MAGYLWFFPTLDWADAFVNAAMILSGMGPMAVPETTGAKIFSGCYAIYSRTDAGDECGRGICAIGASLLA